MTSSQVKNQLKTYLPLLSDRQQEILLDMVKNILQIDTKEKRISVEQYNTEIDSHDTILKESSKWFKRK